MAEVALESKLAAFDSSPRGQRVLVDAVMHSDDPDSPSNDALRTRLYVGRSTRIAQKRALARARGLSAADEKLEVAKALRRLRHPDGGFTRHPLTEDEVTTGFMVSPYPEREKARHVDELRPRDIREHLQENADLWEEPGNYQGAWHDPETGMVSLDVTVVTTSAEEARRIALERNQVAFFDAQTGRSVTVNANERGRIAHLQEESQS